MIKTQVQLEEWQYEGLKRLGAKESRSLSDLVRDSVARMLSHAEPRSPESMEAIAGKYEGGPLDGLKDHDRAWLESIR